MNGMGGSQQQRIKGYVLYTLKVSEQVSDPGNKCQVWKSLSVKHCHPQDILNIISWSTLPSIGHSYLEVSMAHHITST
ncbi:hypothetical protein XELAEV_18003778mg [Xenopus laevis]|nr:hypothetical protein XELAEV_18003778mg [Xenopus laevis]